MIQAYSEMYLEDAMTNLAELMDFVECESDVTLEQFVDMFLVSGIAEQIGKGVPKYLVGKSGCELAYEVFDKTGHVYHVELHEHDISYGRSASYWCGWILAYYQWKTGYSYQKIFSYITIEELLNMYPTLHEASEEKFVDILNARIEKNSHSQLQKIRLLSGYSQSQLSHKSGVSLRSIQMYEQGHKDISKASVSTVLSLAKVLGCEIEELL